jgi:hypothetical protein
MEARFENRTLSVPVAPARTSPLPDIVGLGGAVAGLIGGVAMALVGVMIALATGTDIWQAPKLIANAIGGTPNVSPGFEAGPVLLGSLMHLLTAALFGALFGIVFRRTFNLPSSFGIPLVSGLIYGLGIWFVDYFMVLPMLNPGLSAVYSPAFVIQNLTYGVVLGIAYSYLRP